MQSSTRCLSRSPRKRSLRLRVRKIPIAPNCQLKRRLSCVLRSSVSADPSAPPAFDAIILPSLSALIMIPSNSQEYLRQDYPPLRSLSPFPVYRPPFPSLSRLPHVCLRLRPYSCPRPIRCLTPPIQTKTPRAHHAHANIPPLPRRATSRLALCSKGLPRSKPDN